MGPIVAKFRIDSGFTAERPTPVSANMDFVWEHVAQVDIGHWT